MGRILVKPGVAFAVIASEGFRILGSLDRVAREWSGDLMITSGTDGVHSGPTDPHYLGKAYDVRTHDLQPERKDQLLKLLLFDLMEHSSDVPLPVSGGLGTTQYWGWIEKRGTVAEHLHIQCRQQAPPQKGPLIA